MNANDLLATAESLPLELKIQLINKLLSSIDPTRKEIDELWAKEAESRVADIASGKVTPIPGEKVFREIKGRFNK